MLDEISQGAGLFIDKHQATEFQNIIRRDEFPAKRSQSSSPIAAKAVPGVIINKRLYFLQYCHGFNVCPAVYGRL
jgi:hypothetical protein